MSNPLLVAFSWMEWKRLVQGEARASGLFNGVVISSLVDKGCYPAAKWVQDRMNIVRNGVDLEHFRFQAYEPEKNLIVFCAKLDYFAKMEPSALSLLAQAFIGGMGSSSTHGASRETLQTKRLHNSWSTISRPSSNRQMTPLSAKI